MKEQKVFYYKDELNDEFSGITRKTRVIDEKFKYVHKNIFWKICEFVAYRIIMLPFAYLYTKIKFRNKIVGKEKLKAAGKSGYFMYANHTLMGGDAFIPNIVNFPRKTYTIVHPDNISTKFGPWNTFLLMNGALPLPSNLKASKNFFAAMEHFAGKGKALQIYPEAHIWPYYTKIRPFKEISFRYPVKFDKPVFCFTNTYHKRRHGDKVKVITYIDGPFYKNPDLPPKEQEMDLRNRVYEAMCERAKLSTYEYTTFIKIDSEEGAK